LRASDTPYSGKAYRVFLQGSYGNDTNIYSESDVDVVICLDECWGSDLSELSGPDKVAYESSHVTATYSHVDFKRDVLDVLTAQYDDDVEAGDKAIAIAANGNRRRSDVIVSTEFRRYRRYVNATDQDYVTGICFFNKSGARIENYPRQHSENLTRKHQSTGNRLKPMIRALKNLRGKLVDDGVIESGRAPSYYLEGLLYNVPDELFVTSLQQTFVNSVNWLQSDADKAKLLCAHELYYLLWDGSPTSWPRAHCDEFLSAATDLWNEW
jgi:hypothetical protein